MESVHVYIKNIDIHITYIIYIENIKIQISYKWQYIARISMQKYKHHYRLQSKVFIK